MFRAPLASVALLAVATLGCGVPSPAQQASDFANAEACVAQHWGEPLSQLAAACLGSSEAAAADVVADVEAILKAAGVALPTIYQQDPKVQAAVAKRAKP